MSPIIIAFNYIFIRKLPTGEAIQEMIILITLSMCNPAVPRITIEKPMIEPIWLWVEETGNFNSTDKSIQQALPKRYIFVVLN